MSNDLKLNSFYRAVVEDNNDPEKRGRVRARIWGIHTPEKVKTVTEGIPTNELPWCEPCIPIMEGGISGFGMFGVPLQGSHIMIFFENGNLATPRYFAALPGVPTELPDTTKGFNDPAGVYPTEGRLNQPDWHRLARGEKGNTLIQTKNSLRATEEPRSPAAPQYPHNWVIVTHGGITIELDSTPGQERLHFYHPTNSYIEIDKDGNMVVKSGQKKYEIVLSDKIKSVAGKDEQIIGNDLEIRVTGDCTITTTGIINLN